jgi:hypothetical protein
MTDVSVTLKILSEKQEAGTLQQGTRNVEVRTGRPPLIFPGFTAAFAALHFNIQYSLFDIQYSFPA